MDTSSQSRHQRPVALIERCASNQQQIVQSLPIYNWPYRIGRSFAADFILDDPYVAEQHVLLDVVNGELVLQVGVTTNGVQVDQQHLQSGAQIVLKSGQIWRIGTTDLRVRRAHDPIPPEKLLVAYQQGTLARRSSKSEWLGLVSACLALLGMQLGEDWLSSYPNLPVHHYLLPLVYWLFGVGLWALGWALGNKLFQGQLHYRAHLGVTLRYSLIAQLLWFLLPMLAFVMDWTALSRLTPTLVMFVLCLAVWAHLCVILPARRLVLATSIGGLFITMIGLHSWFNLQQEGRWFSQLYHSTLMPTTWRLAPTQSVETLLQAAQKMQPQLDKQAKKDHPEEGDSRAED